jgi:hypothetical protein
MAAVIIRICIPLPLSAFPHDSERITDKSRNRMQDTNCKINMEGILKNKCIIEK